MLFRSPSNRDFKTIRCLLGRPFSSPHSQRIQKTGRDTEKSEAQIELCCSSRLSTSPRNTVAGPADTPRPPPPPSFPPFSGQLPSRAHLPRLAPASVDRPPRPRPAATRRPRAATASTGRHGLGLAPPSVERPPRPRPRAASVCSPTFPSTNRPSCPHAKLRRRHPPAA